MEFGGWRRMPAPNGKCSARCVTRRGRRAVPRPGPVLPFCLLPLRLPFALLPPHAVPWSCMFAFCLFVCCLCFLSFACFLLARCSGFALDLTYLLYPFECYFNMLYICLIMNSKMSSHPHPHPTNSLSPAVWYPGCRSKLGRSMFICMLI